MPNDRLNIVNDSDEIIGEEFRSIIHEKGLLHRETHVWFYTPNGEIIFQHRSKDKDTYPDLLDATVGGHVEMGETYQAAALKETLEETGLAITEKDLKFLKKFKMKNEDLVTKTINYAFKSEYAYLFNGDLKDLQVEAGKAVGFESWPLEKLLNMPETDKQKFLPAIFFPEFQETFRLIKNLFA